MSPLDRIAQLTAQLADAREQASRDSATIARLASERAALLAAGRDLLSLVKSWADDIGGCDHSVGICMCPELHTIEIAESVFGGAS